MGVNSHLCGLTTIEFGSLGTVEHPAQLRCDSRRTAIRGVDMQPEPVLLAERGDCGHGVDTGGGCGPNRGDNREGPKPRGDILVHCLPERDRIHAEALVDGDAAQPLLADTKHDAGLLH